METALWSWLKDRLPEGHYSRIESMTSPGFPDVHYTIAGEHGTIELKKSRSPNAKLPFKKGGLRDTQIRWIDDDTEQGGRVFIVAQVGEWVFLLNAVDVFRTFNSMTFEDLSEGSLYQLRMKQTPATNSLRSSLERTLTTPNE